MNENKFIPPTNSKASQSNENELIERLLGTDDCGTAGIGVMVIGKTFYVGTPRTANLDTNETN